MKLAKSAVLALALFGAFSAGLGVLVRLLQPIGLMLGWTSTGYIVGMLVLLGAIFVYFYKGDKI
jgi:hypothetical protein